MQQPSTKKYGIGQTLFLNLPFFTNADTLLRDWHIDMINDYFIVKKFNVPLGSDLENLNAFRTDCFILIENELMKIKNYESKNG